jgi:hypothetical protein
MTYGYLVEMKNCQALDGDPLLQRENHIRQERGGIHNPVRVKYRKIWLKVIDFTINYYFFRSSKTIGGARRDEGMVLRLIGGKITEKGRQDLRVINI